MALPKRKKSKRLCRIRRASHRHKIFSVKPCPECGAPHMPHRVCPKCGYYKGRQVITVESE